MKVLFVIIPLISAILFFVLLALFVPEYSLVLFGLAAIALVILFEEIRDAKIKSRFKGNKDWDDEWGANPIKPSPPPSSSTYFST